MARFAARRYLGEKTAKRNATQRNAIRDCASAGPLGCRTLPQLLGDFRKR